MEHWLKTSTAVSIQYPKTKTDPSADYTGPSFITLQLKYNAHSILVIGPASYFTEKRKNGNDYRYLRHYITGVVSYTYPKPYPQQAQVYYFKAPALYTWLKQNQWLKEVNHKEQAKRQINYFPGKRRS